MSFILIRTEVQYCTSCITIGIYCTGCNDVHKSLPSLSILPSTSTPSLISSLGSRCIITWSHSPITMHTPVLVGHLFHQDRMCMYILFLYKLVCTWISLLLSSVCWISFSTRIASLSWILQAYNPSQASLLRKISLSFARV